MFVNQIVHYMINSGIGFKEKAPAVCKLVNYAYILGRHKATKEVSNAYTDLLLKMHSNAKKSRYWRLIETAIDFKPNYLYFADYSDAALIFGLDEIKKEELDILTENCYYIKKSDCKNTDG